MARSFLPKPQGMAGLQRPFIRVNYGPGGLCGSIWPRRPPLPFLPSEHKTSSSPLLSSSPKLCATPLSTPYPCLMKENGSNPSRGSPEQEVNFNLRKLFSCKGQAPGYPGLAQALCDKYRALFGPPPTPPPRPFTSPHSQEGGWSHCGGGGSHSHRAHSAFLPVLSRRSEVILSAPPGCLAFHVFVLFFFKSMKYDKWLFQEAKHKCFLKQWFLNVNVLPNHPGTWNSRESLSWHKGNI